MTLDEIIQVLLRDGYHAAAKLLENSVEVVHAEWYIYDDEYDLCSNCEYLHPRQCPDGVATAYQYCPACGAKMRLANKRQEDDHA